MAYLHAPRLVFSGDFLSDVSTVNNDPAHYNNATFQSKFQEPGVGATNGWWNPEDGAIFDFRHCSVQQVMMPDGAVHETADAQLTIGFYYNQPLMYDVKLRGQRLCGMPFPKQQGFNIGPSFEYSEQELTV